MTIKETKEVCGLLQRMNLGDFDSGIDDFPETGKKLSHANLFNEVSSRLSLFHKMAKIEFYENKSHN